MLKEFCLQEEQQSVSIYNRDCETDVILVQHSKFVKVFKFSIVSNFDIKMQAQHRNNDKNSAETISDLPSVSA